MRTSKKCSLFSFLRTSFQELFYENKAKQGLWLLASGLVSGDPHFCQQIPSEFLLNTRCHSILGQHFDLSRNSGCCYYHVFSEFRVSDRLSFSSEPGNDELTRCWNCGRAPALPGPFLACGSCRGVQPVDQSVDFFQMFGLKKRSLQLNSLLELYDAYQTLSKPLLRAIYLLKLEGINVDEERTVTDVDLLAEMMHIREAIEEANDSEALKQIQAGGKFETWSRSFQQAFERQDFDDSIASIERMRYYERALEEIAKKL